MMNNTLRKITVTVLEEQYHLVSDEDEQMVRNAARMVESALHDLRERTRDSNLQESKLAVLVALRLALRSCVQESERARAEVDHLQAKKAQEEERLKAQDITKRVQHILSLCDRAEGESAAIRL